jgi:hypothetical protein
MECLAPRPEGLGDTLAQAPHALPDPSLSPLTHCSLFLNSWFLGALVLGSSFQGGSLLEHIPINHARLAQQGATKTFDVPYRMPFAKSEAVVGRQRRRDTVAVGELYPQAGLTRAFNNDIGKRGRVARIIFSEGPPEQGPQHSHDTLLLAALQLRDEQRLLHLRVEFAEHLTRSAILC